MSLFIIPKLNNPEILLQFHVNKSGVIRQVKKVVQTTTDADGDTIQEIVEKRRIRTPQQVFDLTGVNIETMINTPANQWAAEGFMSDDKESQTKPIEKSVIAAEL